MSCKISTSILLDQDLRDSAHKVAYANHRSFTAFIEYLLTGYLKKNYPAILSDPRGVVEGNYDAVQVEKVKNGN